MRRSSLNNILFQVCERVSKILKKGSREKDLDNMTISIPTGNTLLQHEIKNGSAGFQGGEGNYAQDSREGTPRIPGGE